MGEPAELLERFDQPNLEELFFYLVELAGPRGRLPIDTPDVVGWLRSDATVSPDSSAFAHGSRTLRSRCACAGRTSG